MDLYLSLKSSLDASRKTKKAEKINNSDLWKFMLEAATKHLSTFGEFINFIDRHSKIDPTFVNSVPSEVSATISAITSLLEDANISITDKLNQSKPLLVLAPFLPYGTLCEIIAFSITLIQKYINQNLKLPIDYLKHIDNFYFEALDYDTVDQICLQINGFFDSPVGPAAIAFFAAISVDCFNVKPEIEPFVYDTIINYLAKKPYCQSALYLIQKFYDQNRGNEEIVREKIVPLLFSTDDNNLSYMACKAIKSQIKSGLNNNIETLEQVIENYPQISNIDDDNFSLLYFFKVIRKFIFYAEDDDDELNYEIDEDIAKKISGFILKVIKETKNINIKRKCIEIIGALGSSCSLYIDEFYNEILDVSYILIKNKIHITFPQISSFATALLKMLKDDDDTKVTQIIPELAKYLEEISVSKNDTNALFSKEEFVLAMNLAEITKFHDRLDFSSQLTSFIKHKLSSLVREEQLRACGIFLSCSSKFKLESVIEFATKIVDIALITDSIDEMNLFVLVFHKMMKHHEIPETLFVSFIDKLSNNQLPVLFNTSPHHLIPVADQLFDFMSDFSIKYPTNCIFVQKIISWLEDKPFYAFRNICNVVTTLASAGCLKEGHCTLISQAILELIPKIRNMNHIGAAASAVRAMYKVFPKSISPPENFIALFAKYIIDEDSEDDSNGEEDQDDGNSIINGKNVESKMNNVESKMNNVDRKLNTVDSMNESQKRNKNCKKEEEEEEEESTVEKEDEDDEEEDTDDKIEDMTNQIIIIKFILDVYKSDKSIKVDVDTTIHFFDFLPYIDEDDDEDNFESFILALDELVEHDERFFFAKLGLASLYADMLIIDKSTIESFDKETVCIIKKSLAKIVKCHPKIRKTLHEMLSESKENLKKFCLLTK